MPKCPRCGAEGKLQPTLVETFNAFRTLILFARIDCGSTSCGLWIADIDRQQVELERNGSQRHLKLKAA